MLNVIYLFEAIWGLNHLDFIGYNKIYTDFARLGAFYALSQACEDHWGTPNHIYNF